MTAMTLEEELEKELWHTVDVASDHIYTPHIFMQMLKDHGGVETSKRLLANSEAQTGLFRLYELKLLHESMEAVVIKEKYRSLFTQAELAEAYRRLEELRYFEKGK
jgi:hypothetical protein